MTIKNKIIIIIIASRSHEMSIIFERCVYSSYEIFSLARSSSYTNINESPPSIATTIYQSKYFVSNVPRYHRIKATIKLTSKSKVIPFASKVLSRMQ